MSSLFANMFRPIHVQELIDRGQKEGYEGLALLQVVETFFARKQLKAPLLLLSLGIAALFAALFLRPAMIFVAVLPLYCFVGLWLVSAGVFSFEKFREGEGVGRRVVHEKSMKRLFSIPVTRWVPLATMLLLVIVFAVSVAVFGFGWKMLVAFVLSAVGVLMVWPRYNRYCSQCEQEAAGFADWATDMQLAHFEELIAAWEVWRTPSINLDILRQNLNVERYFRKSRLKISMLAGMISVMSVFPIIPFALGIADMAVAKERSTEEWRQRAIVENDGETETAAPADEVVTPTADEGNNMEEEVVENEDFEGDLDVPEEENLTGEAQNQVSQNACYSLSELDELPRLTGSEEHFKKAISQKILGRVPENVTAAGTYIEFKISAQGRAYDIDLSAQDDGELMTIVIQAFSEMTFVPGRINGQPVNVKTNITL